MVNAKGQTMALSLHSSLPHLLVSGGQTCHVYVSLDAAAAVHACSTISNNPQMNLLVSCMSPPAAAAAAAAILPPCCCC
jgi:hypothetical protein